MTNTNSSSKTNYIRMKSDEKIIHRIALLNYMIKKNEYKEFAIQELERIKEVCKNHNREYLISEGEKFYSENYNKYYNK